MGLLLSVLVACVGVAELLAFYFNIRRNLVTEPPPPHISDLTKKYYDELQTRPITESATIQTLTVTCEEIELEIPRSVIRSRSTSPRRFLLTEKTDPNPNPRKKSPRRFLVSNPSEDNSNSLVPSFIVEEDSSEHEQRQFVLKNRNQRDIVREKSPIPLPEQFIVTEPKSRSSSPDVSSAKKHYHYEEFKRSASPYPPLVLPTPTPRNSICSELLDNPLKISVVEVDEEGLSKSPTPERIDQILLSQHSSTQFWTNKLLVVKKTKKQRSCSPSPLPLKNNLDRRKSKSENFLCNEEEEENNNNKNNEGFDEKYLDSLDGVKRKKLSRNNRTRRSKKRKENGNSSDDFVSSSAKNNETAKTLTAAASVLKNTDEKNGRINVVASSSSSVDDGGENQLGAVEPFWVNR